MTRRDYPTCVGCHSPISERAELVRVRKAGTADQEYAGNPTGAFHGVCWAIREAVKRGEWRDRGIDPEKYAFTAWDVVNVEPGNRG